MKFSTLATLLSLASVSICTPLIPIGGGGDDDKPCDKRLCWPGPGGRPLPYKPFPPHPPFPVEPSSVPDLPPAPTGSTSSVLPDVTAPPNPDPFPPDNCVPGELICILQENGCKDGFFGVCIDSCTGVLPEPPPCSTLSTESTSTVDYPTITPTPEPYY